jgi:hypothetical protein
MIFEPVKLEVIAIIFGFALKNFWDKRLSRQSVRRFFGRDIGGE